MKRLVIEIILKDDKVVTSISTIGFESKKIEDQFELLGIIENVKDNIKDRIKVLAREKRNGL